MDRYYPDLKLGFEYDGKQHEEYNKYIHKSKKNFEYYKECDKLKEVACKNKGITLIRVAYNYKITPDALKLDILKANKKLHNQIFGGK
jgi:very-short-patch-repair endonuclease